jgi:hypothetical protein
MYTCTVTQDFCTDIITIETADHARLQLQLSYNWRFEVHIYETIIHFQATVFIYTSAYLGRSQQG